MIDVYTRNAEDNQKSPYRRNRAFKFNEWRKICIGREFFPYVDDTLMTISSWILNTGPHSCIWGVGIWVKGSNSLTPAVFMMCY